MAKFETHKFSDLLVEHTILGTNWIIQEWIDNKEKIFTFYNSFTDIDDLYNSMSRMPEQYKTRELALQAISDFIDDYDFFVMEIERARRLIHNYQKANLTYMK
jgi:hypothetical protein